MRRALVELLRKLSPPNPLLNKEGEFKGLISGVFID